MSRGLAMGGVGPTSRLVWPGGGGEGGGPRPFALSVRDDDGTMRGQILAGDILLSATSDDLASIAGLETEVALAGIGDKWWIEIEYDQLGAIVKQNSDTDHAVIRDSIGGTWGTETIGSVENGEFPEPVLLFEEEDELYDGEETAPDIVFAKKYRHLLAEIVADSDEREGTTIAIGETSAKIIQHTATHLILGGSIYSGISVGRLGPLWR